MRRVSQNLCQVINPSGTRTVAFCHRTSSQSQVRNVWKIVKYAFLILHMRIHTEERPYWCKIYGKSFRQSQHLPGHKLTHKKLCKVFQCAFCCRFLPGSVTLRKHILGHVGEKPHYRNFNLCVVTSRQAKGHKKVHNLVKEFQCVFCLIKLRHKNTPMNHLLNHINERP